VAKIQQMGPEKDRAGCAFLLSDAQGRHRQIFAVRMNEFSDSSRARCARSNRAKAGRRRPREHGIPGAEVVVLQARPLGGCFQLGCDLSAAAPYALVSAFAGTTGIRPGAGLRAPKPPKNSA